MGAIAGIFHPDVPKPVVPDRVRAMASVLARPADGGGDIWTAPGVGLTQSALTADRRVAIGFDGTLTNRHALRKDLGAKGFVLDGDGDAETIVAAWRQWGPKCLQRFEGSFALALYDLGSDSLFLARDRLGTRPLLFACLADGALILASELRGLLAHPLFGAQPDPSAVDDYLALGFVPDDASIVAGVKKLPAAHFLHIRRGRPVPKPVRWWDLDFTAQTDASASALGEELVALMRDSVHARMVPGLASGARLDGDLGSAAMVAFMAEASRSAVETCSLGDPDDSARIVAERFATRHRTAEIVDPSGLDRLQDAFDEPLGDPAALVDDHLDRFASERARLLFSSAGCDESFASHARYRSFVRKLQARGLVPERIRTAAAAQPRLPRGVQALGHSPEEIYAEALVVTGRRQRARLYRPAFADLLRGHRAEDRIVRAMAEAPAADPLSRAQYADLRILLPGNALTRIDRLGSALGLDTRLPFLDHRLVEFAARLPARMRLRGGKGKWLMRKALEGHLPREILGRAETGATAPVADWFRGPLADRAGIARGSALFELGWFDEAAIARLAADHRAARADHGRLLWQLLMLEGSLQRLFGLGPSPSYSASTKYSPSGGALKPSAARSRA